MSDPTNPAAQPAASPPPAAPAAPLASPGMPVQVHVHTAPAAAPQAPAAQPQQPAAAPAEPKPAQPPAAPVKPPYVNPYAQRPVAPAQPPVAASPAAQPAAPVAAPAQPPQPPVPPAVDPQVAALTQRVDDMRAVLAITATNAINALPESLRGFVVAQYGDDPSAQIRGIESMRAHGLIPAAPQVVPQGATTLPAGNAAPPPSAQTANPDAAVLAQYEALKTSPIAQAAFYRLNTAAITRARASAPRAN